ncbi:uncharacterized protein [Littorina saxatilis]|uniref:uncharacterized protein n=1 Tax=Littorina saxatilis TaxID=31220 RepID=UPI0038B42235
MSNTATICALFLACFAAPLFGLAIREANQAYPDGCPENYLALLEDYLITVRDIARINTTRLPYSNCREASNAVTNAMTVAQACLNIHTPHLNQLLAKANDIHRDYTGIRERCS